MFAVSYNGSGPIQAAQLSDSASSANAAVHYGQAAGPAVTDIGATVCNSLRSAMLNHYRDGTGEPLVLIHGIGSRWQVWMPVLGRLATERTVIALDLPGFGASPLPPPGTPPGVRSLARLVLDFLDELGIDRPHVAGNSLGGQIALELAKTGRIRSANGLSPAGFHEGAEARFQKLSLELTLHAARRLAPVADTIAATPLGRQLMFSQMAAHPARMSAADAAENLRGVAGSRWFRPTLEAMLAEPFSGGEEIAVPVTIAWAEKDHLLLPRQAARAARQIPAARSITLTGCGHVPTYDDPAQVADVLLAGSAR